jgi:hypothetical protein
LNSFKIVKERFLSNPGQKKANEALGEMEAYNQSLI